MFTIDEIHVLAIFHGNLLKICNDSLIERKNWTSRTAASNKLIEQLNTLQDQIRTLAEQGGKSSDKVTQI